MNRMRNHGNSIHMTDQQREKIRKLYKGGDLSAEAIGLLMGFSQQAVLYVCADLPRNYVHNRKRYDPKNEVDRQVREARIPYLQEFYAKGGILNAR
jgi:uncharacterized protein YcsI (UPF0317 family)